MANATSSSPDSAGLFYRMWRSIFPAPVRPTSKQSLLRTLLFHFRPRTVPEATLRFTLSWGLGGMAAVLVFLQLATGVLLLFAYEPSPAGAYESIIRIQNDIFFGPLIRNIHHWSANVLVLVIFLHMLRVFFTGAYRAPRQFNWLIGLCLFGGVLIANFTGYLLPYDQLAYWAVTVSTGMLAYIPMIGNELQDLIRVGGGPGSSALHLFYGIHTAVLPASLVILLAFHFWRIRKAGGLVVPRPPEAPPLEKPNRVPFLPNLFVRELAVALVVIAGVLTLSTFFNAPLEDPANPGLSPNPTRAPWYFSGLQELLLHLNPMVAVFIVPVTVIGALVLIPYLNCPADTRGIWFASRTGRRMAVVSAMAGLVITPAAILVDEFLIKAGGSLTSGTSNTGFGLIPPVVLASTVAAYYLVVKRRFSATRNETIQAVFILLVTILVVLTIVGVWFRGPGMILIWPWS
jgi:quinol-cytochrome oxidoreductase complex cytochrome b subunit